MYWISEKPNNRKIENVENKRNMTIILQRIKNEEIGSK